VAQFRSLVARAPLVALFASRVVLAVRKLAVICS
jgi:hypothetical protein